MMRITIENKANRKRFAVSVICGVIAIVAVCASVLFAAFAEAPAIVRIRILILAAVTAVIGTGAGVILDAKAGYFACPHCIAFFIPTTSAYMKGRHTLTTRKLTCPACGETGMCRKRITR